MFEPSLVINHQYFYVTEELFNSKWNEVAKCKEGTSQSPINIVTSAAQYDASKTQVEFNLERTSINETVWFQNDGETGRK